MTYLGFKYLYEKQKQIASKIDTANADEKGLSIYPPSFNPMVNDSERTKENISYIRSVPYKHLPKNSFFSRSSKRIARSDVTGGTIPENQLNNTDGNNFHPNRVITPWSYLSQDEDWKTFPKPSNKPLKDSTRPKETANNKLEWDPTHSKSAIGISLSENSVSNGSESTSTATNQTIGGISRQSLSSYETENKVARIVKSNELFSQLIMILSKTSGGSTRDSSETKLEDNTNLTTTGHCADKDSLSTCEESSNSSIKLPSNITIPSISDSSTNVSKAEIEKVSTGDSSGSSNIQDNYESKSMVQNPLNSYPQKVEATGISTQRIKVINNIKSLQMQVTMTIQELKHAAEMIQLFTLTSDKYKLKKAMEKYHLLSIKLQALQDKIKKLLAYLDSIGTTSENDEKPTNIVSFNGSFYMSKPNSANLSFLQKMSNESRQYNTISNVIKAHKDLAYKVINNMR